MNEREKKLYDLNHNKNDDDIMIIMKQLNRRINKLRLINKKRKEEEVKKREDKI